MHESEYMLLIIACFHRAYVQVGVFRSHVLVWKGMFWIRKSSVTARAMMMIENRFKIEAVSGLRRGRRLLAA